MTRALVFIYFACELSAAADVSLATATDEGRALAGVAAARRRPQVAVWSRRRILWSDDGGRRFRAVLDGDGEITGAAIGDDTLYVARGGRLGVHLPDGSEAWRALPADAGDRIAAGGGVLALYGSRAPSADETIGAARLAFSRDGGRTWRAQRLTAVDDEVREVFLDDSGVAHAAVAASDCSWGALRRLRGAPGRLRQVDELRDTEVRSLALGARGAWALTGEWYEREPVIAVDGSGARRTLWPGSDGFLLGASDGRATFIVAGDKLFRVAPSPALLAPAPAARALAAGAAGLFLLGDDDRLYRYASDAFRPVAISEAP